MGSVMRFRPFSIQQDPESCPEYEAVCTGESRDCGEKSAAWITPHPVEVWMVSHTAETGHRHYRRTFTDFAVTDPAPGPSRKSTS